MKKISGKIAMILVIIMLASSFTSCFTVGLMNSLGSNTTGPFSFLFTLLCGLMITVPLDIVTSPIQIPVYVAKKKQEREREERAKFMENIDTFSSIISMHEAQLTSLAQKINSLPEDRLVLFKEAVNSFSEKEISIMAEAVDNMTEKEIIASIEILNSMSDEELIATLNSFQQIEFRYKD